jgi:hypothetical protein
LKTKNYIRKEVVEMFSIQLNDYPFHEMKHYRHFVLMNMWWNMLIKSHNLNLGPQSINENKIENRKGDLMKPYVASINK